MAGFDYAYTIGGGEPNIQTFIVKDEAVITQGALCNLESGEADLGATNDAAFIGVALEAVDNTADGLTVRCIINPDAVYSVVDANARVAGATLDIATGAAGVAATSNADLIVIANSSASERTLVMIAPGEHYLR
jgi:hypothetical protein